ncbi:MAG: hypothetical protein U1F61_10920 [Opitutaceae bacterium]
MNQTIILHGYSDTADSFRPLAQYLTSRGIPAVDLHLGNYVSLEDHVTIPDLAKAFHHALLERGMSLAAGSFNLVVHSTGSLVAREWMTRYFLEQGLPCPVRRYLMLAPANFGSPLASLGKTMMGRVIKGWKSGFESGREVLNALELASPYTRNLARRDLFGKRSFYDPAQCFTAVIVGSKPYQTGLRRLADRPGGDGTVYVSTANLNASGISIQFGRKPDPTLVREWPRAAKQIAFGVLADRDHESVTRPDLGNRKLGDLITRFLGIGTEVEYHAYSKWCDELTAVTLPANPTEDIFHTYQNLAAHVQDDLGFSVTDYFLEFFEKARTPADESRVDRLMVKIHEDVLESVHVFGPDPSHRSLLFDLTDLRKAIAGGKRLMFSLSAAPLSPLLSFAAGAANDVSELAVHGAGGSSFWRDNQTLLADLQIERQPSADVFRLEQL